MRSSLVFWYSSKCYFYLPLVPWKRIHSTTDLSTSNVLANNLNMQNEHNGEAPGSCYFTKSAGQSPVKVFVQWRGRRDRHWSLESHPRPFRRYFLFRSSRCHAKLLQSIWLKEEQRKGGGNKPKQLPCYY